ncbi:hypothetical protein FIBSPDRAFT_1047011 [Athelia psychrophila]|uniref:Uncharacterized protein n=1 Tax=Athelia psychrophila TaxID=1759441 RepID=A0A166FUZ7_9AGAM|nr:hypothetical protein FIBSPDRAFT_1047011 [Fibularhizoctonia sp. CBS 109695]
MSPQAAARRTRLSFIVLCYPGSLVGKAPAELGEEVFLESGLLLKKYRPICNIPLLGLGTRDVNADSRPPTHFQRHASRIQRPDASDPHCTLSTAPEHDSNHYLRHADSPYDSRQPTADSRPRHTGIAAEPDSNCYFTGTGSTCKFPPSISISPSTAVLPQRGPWAIAISEPGSTPGNILHLKLDRGPGTAPNRIGYLPLMTRSQSVLIPLRRCTLAWTHVLLAIRHSPFSPSRPPSAASVGDLRIAIAVALVSSGQPYLRCGATNHESRTTNHELPASAYAHC